MTDRFQNDKFQNTNDERARDRKEDLEAQPDELGTDAGQVGQDSAGHGAETQGLSPIEESANESVEELADTNQDLEAEAVEGLEDAADHPERPAHTHLEYGNPDDVPPLKRDDEAA